jgi:hypothetical protein
LNEYQLIDSENKPTDSRFVIMRQDSLRTITWHQPDMTGGGLAQVLDRVVGPIERFCNRLVIAGFYHGSSGC